MEERRVQRSGASTLTVSLPAEWVDAVGLDKGDVVLVAPTEDGGLTLYPSRTERRAPRAAVLHARRVPDADAAADALRALYASGWERLHVAAEGGLPDGLAARLRDVAERLPGLEVLSETRERVDIAVSLDAEAFPLRALLRRLEMTGTSALHDAMAALTARDPALADGAHVRARDGERLRALVRRQATLAVTRPGLTRAVAGSTRDALVLRSAGDALADVARHADAVADAVLDVIGFDVDVPEHSLDALTRAHERVAHAHATATGALFGKDAARAFEARRLAPDAKARALTAIRAVRAGGHASVARRLARIGAHLEAVATRADDIALLALEALGLDETDAWARVEEKDATPHH